MKKQRSARSGAFSLPELVLVLGIIFILGALLVPTLADAKRRANRTQCLDNLKQIGLGFTSFAHDHNNLFPMQVSTKNGGSLEYYLEGNKGEGEFYFAFRHFQPIARELKTPKVLICPADDRGESASFKSLCNANVSYFIGPAAKYSQPDSILLGDWNLARIGPGQESVIVLSSQNAEWSAELHNRSGNLLFADGHAKTFNNAEVQKIAGQLSGTTILPPVVPQNDNGYPVKSTEVEQPVCRSVCRLGATSH